MFSNVQQEAANGKPWRRWLRFAVGLALLSAAVAFFASGYAPPGTYGEVLRHNQEYDIDASPLLYSEVENMHELEKGLADLRAGAREPGETVPRNL